MTPQEQRQRLVYVITADEAAREFAASWPHQPWRLDRSAAPDIRQLRDLQELQRAIREVQDFLLLAYDEWDKAERPTREQVAAPLDLGSRQALRKRYEKARETGPRVPDWVPRSGDATPVPLAEVLRGAADMLSDIRTAIRHDQEKNHDEADNALTAQMSQYADALREYAACHPGAEQTPYVNSNDSGGAYQQMLDEFRRCRRQSASPEYLRALAADYARLAAAYADTLEEAQRNGPQLGYDIAIAQHSKDMLRLRGEIESRGGHISGSSVWGPDDNLLATWAP